MADLKNARKKINEIDKEMARLFELRMEAVSEVAQYKREHGLPIYDPEREEENVRRGAANVSDPELRAYYVNFLKNNMAVSRAYQDKLMEGMKVAYSGTVGAFAHIATKKLFPTARSFAYPDFAAAYRAVESGECDAAVLPLENSYNGEVGQVTDSARHTSRSTALTSANTSIRLSRQNTSRSKMTRALRLSQVPRLPRFSVLRCLSAISTQAE